MWHPNSFNARQNLQVGAQSYQIFQLSALEQYGLNIGRLPFSLKILLENLLRTEDGVTVRSEDIRFLANWDAQATPTYEIAFSPARVVLQDFTGVPAIVDLAAMREAMAKLGGDPQRINPLIPVDMVIDHSLIVDEFAHNQAYQRNVDIEYRRNLERYQFARWGQSAFDNFRVVPPGMGIVHQVNLEHLSKVVFHQKDLQQSTLYPDSCVGTDSHTPMVNGLGVLAWGVGGIEAEAAMLGQPISMLIPRVVGFKLEGALSDGVTATDLVLTITDMLRQHGVVGKFVEFYGEGIGAIPVADRATLGNMSPEYGSTVAMFPIDEQSLSYMRLVGHTESDITVVEHYTKAQGLWHDPSTEADYSEYLYLDLSTVQPSIAGPKRPQDRILLKAAQRAYSQDVVDYRTANQTVDAVSLQTPKGDSYELTEGAVVLASITSCTNTSNPSVMIAAALVAKKAHEKGLKRKPWVKTSLAPGSKVVTDYYDQAGLTPYLDALGFNLVGYGCATCCGNSGPLVPEVATAIDQHHLTVASVLSGNRNFEGRIHPQIRMNYLMSPPLVVAYAIAGTMNIDLYQDSLGVDTEGNAVYFQDIWPSTTEVQAVMDQVMTTDLYRKGYKDVFVGNARWQQLPTPQSELFAWDEASTYVREPSYFDQMQAEPCQVQDIQGARVLVKLGDSVTTDHISPAGAIPLGTPAADYLTAHGVAPGDFNAYGSRRGNHEVMIRGTFANVRLRNQVAPGTEGGFTRDFSQFNAPVVTIYEASRNYLQQGTPLIILAGKEYGSGSSRDWAAKGTKLLGVKAVIAESYERIHRSNLVGMGVLPLQYLDGQNAQSLGLVGDEAIEIMGITALNQGETPRTVQVKAGSVYFEALVRLDTPSEADYYRHGGIMPYVLRSLMTK